MIDLADQLRRLYAAFNARDIDAVLAAMSEHIDWPNAWEGGRLYGRDAVREYWRRQWAQIDSHVDPRAISDLPDGRVAVTVHQVVRSLSGELLSDGEVSHVYELHDGLITRMTVEEFPAE